jgi:Zn/Cd-binding protein ZinT
MSLLIDENKLNEINENIKNNPPETIKDVENISNLLITATNVKVGETIISDHYGKWLNVWNELTKDNLEDNLEDNKIKNKKIE